MKTVLILDGDVIAYRCSAVCEERFVEVTNHELNKTRIFKHRTEFKDYLESQGKVLSDTYSIKDGQSAQPLKNVLRTMNNHIARIVREVMPDEVKIFAGEESNFRVDLPLPSKYKGQRSSIRPIHLEQAKEYLIRKYHAEKSYGRETDDSCSIAAYDALKAGKQPIVYFVEKDQYQLDGVTLLYDEADGFKYEVVPELGNLRKEKTAIKGLGLKFLAYQWICHDKVDQYEAYELSKVKFGDTSAFKVIDPCTTEQEVLQSVIKQFQIFYPEPFEYTDWTGEVHESDWKGMMEMYYKCCRMKRSEDDKLDCYELFDKYNVKI